MCVSGGRTDQRPEGVVEVEAGGMEPGERERHEGGGQSLPLTEGPHTGPQHEGVVSARHAHSGCRVNSN